MKLTVSMAKLTVNLFFIILKIHFVNSNNIMYNLSKVKYRMDDKIEYKN